MGTDGMEVRERYRDIFLKNIDYDVLIQNPQIDQEAEIYFNFVGRFVPPAFGEVELTPEELEEIRKREEENRQSAPRILPEGYLSR